MEHSTDKEKNNLEAKCTHYQPEKYKGSAEQELDKVYELPCGCEKVPLRKLLKAYTCKNCDKIYWYSFCYEKIVVEDETWHCEFCGTC